jgi:hypothetical protein
MAVSQRQSGSGTMLLQRYEHFTKISVALFNGTITIKAQISAAALITFKKNPKPFIGIYH